MQEIERLNCQGFNILAISELTGIRPEDLPKAFDPTGVENPTADEKTVDPLLTSRRHRTSILSDPPSPLRSFRGRPPASRGAGGALVSIKE